MPALATTVGKPDWVFPFRRKGIFVNGCFWESHPGYSRSRIPESNRAYWAAKLERNRLQDRQNIEALVQMGCPILRGKTLIERAPPRSRFSIRAAGV